MSARWIELNYVILTSLAPGLEEGAFVERRLLPVIGSVALGQRHYIAPEFADVNVIRRLDPATTVWIR